MLRCDIPAQECGRNGGGVWGAAVSRGNRSGAVVGDVCQQSAAAKGGAKPGRAVAAVVEREVAGIHGSIGLCLSGLAAAIGKREGEPAGVAGPGTDAYERPGGI